MSKKKKNDKEYFPIAEKVREARQDLGMSQKELADKMDVERQRVGQIESGKNCEIKVYYKAAEAMSMSFEQLVAYKKKTKK